LRPSCEVSFAEHLRRVWASC